MKTFYDRPKQVVFADEEGIWQAGIAYEDVIICGCCGGVFEISDIIRLKPDNIKRPIYEYDNWNGISEEIIGGELPEEFVLNEVPEDLQEEVDTDE